MFFHAKMAWPTMVARCGDSRGLIFHWTNRGNGVDCSQRCPLRAWDVSRAAAAVGHNGPGHENVLTKLSRNQRRLRSNGPVGLVVVTCLVIGVIQAGASAQTVADSTDRQAIGLTALLDRLGDAAPTGAGVKVTMVEAQLDGDNGKYTPATSHSNLDGRTYNFFDDGNPDPPLVSSHATNVAMGFFGDTGIAPGVDQIDVYEAGYWMSRSALGGSPPVTETSRVANHSWIIRPDPLGSEYAVRNILRRIDLQADRDNVVVVAGVDNGGSSTFPDALANAHNTIGVGLSNGNHSAGPTTLDPPGRVKPDIVAPSSATSWATGWVSGAASLLVETADAISGPTGDAAQAETIKAVMLTGATKNQFAQWSRTDTQPLDLTYGAGELNIDYAHRILTAGQQEPGVTDPVSATGWDFDTINPNQPRLYFFDAAREIESLSVTTTWHRQVSRSLSVDLADLNMTLYEAEGFDLGAMVDQSISAIDNVEHIYQTGLAAGRYAIELTSDALSEFALAWDTQLMALIGDFNDDGVVGYSDLDLVATYWGKVTVGDDWLGAMPAGRVGQSELDAVLLNWTESIPLDSTTDLLALNGSSGQVPEPAGVGLLLLGTMLVRRGRRF